jgi:hypothetical protein
MNTHLAGKPVEVKMHIEVQAQGDTDKPSASPYSSSHLSPLTLQAF